MWTFAKVLIQIKFNIYEICLKMTYSDGQVIFAKSETLGPELTRWVRSCHQRVFIIRTCKNLIKLKSNPNFTTLIKSYEFRWWFWEISKRIYSCGAYLFVEMSFSKVLKEKPNIWGWVICLKVFFVVHLMGLLVISKWKNLCFYQLMSGYGHG